MNFRYPGAPPFDITQHNIFFGREKEIDELLQLVKTENLTILYGKSGLGKSSLINAGLIIETTKDPLTRTIVIRFGAHNENSKQNTPLETIKEAINNATKPQISRRKIPLVDDGSLWYLLKHSLISEGENTKFLFIFDQFEELFSYDERLIDEFSEQVSEILYTTIPQRFNGEIVKVIDDPNQEEYINFIHKKVQVKFLFAIRSDKMSLLNNLKAKFPNILRNCFELLPLNLENVEKAVVSPASVKGNYDSPEFKFSDRALETVISYLTNKGTQPAESFQLQVVCQHIESVVSEKGISEIDAKDLGELEMVYENYYDNAIKIFTDDKKLEAVKELIENGLILESEERRLTLYEGHILQTYGLSKRDLAKLVNGRIIRSEVDRKGGLVYEISHDSLVQPILRAKSKRDEIKKSLEQEKIRIKKEKQFKKLQEEKQREESRNAKMRYLNILAIVLLGFAIFWGLSSFFKSRELKKNNKELQRIKQETLLGFAKLNNEQDPTLSFLLAKSAYELAKERGYKDTLAEQIILDTYNSSNSIKFNGVYINETNERIVGIDVNEKENILIAFTEENTILNYRLNILNKSPEMLQTKFDVRIRKISLSPSGKYILCSLEDNTVRIIGLKDRFNIVLKGHEKPVNSAFFNKEESRIITASDDGRVIVWNTFGNIISENNRHGKSEVLYANFIGEEKLVSYSTDKSVVFYEFNNESIEDLYRDMGARSDLISFQELPDPNLAVSIFSNGHAYFRDLKSTSNSNFLREKDGDWYTFVGSKITRAKYTSKHDLVIAAKEDKSIIFYDRENQIIKKEIPEAHSRRIKKIVLSQSQNYFATTSEDHTIKLWNMNGQLLQTLYGHTDFDTEIYFSKNDEYIITVAGQKILKWPFKKEKNPVLYRYPGFTVNNASFFLQDSTILTSYSNGAIELYDLSGKLLKEINEVDMLSAITAVPTSKFTDNKYKNHFLVSKSNEITPYKFSFDSIVRFGDLSRINITESLNSLEFTPDASFYIASTSKGNVYAWTTTKNRTEKFYLDSEYKSKGVWGTRYVHLFNKNQNKKLSYYSVITPDNRLLLIEPTSKNNLIENTRDSTSQKYIIEFNDHQDKINLINFARDESKFLTASEDRTIKLYNCSKSIPDSYFLSFNEHLEGITYANFSPDGSLVVSCSRDDNIKIWDSKSGAVILDLKNEDKEIKKVEISQDNKRLLIVTESGFLKIKSITLDVDDIMRKVYEENLYGEIRELSLKEKKKYGISN